MSRPILLAEVLRARLHMPDACRYDCFALGNAAIDGKLGGGLARAGLHELFAAADDDASAAAGFALMLALAAGDEKHRPLAWVREDRCVRHRGMIHAPGLAEIGADPGAIVLVLVEDTRALLRAADDIVRSGAAGAVVIEPEGKAPLLDLTASRRLALTAARSGVLALAVRCGADPQPSAAQTRWRVAAAPSRALPADAPGHPAIDITLLRHRGGLAGFDARLEWNRDTRNFAPLSGDPSAAAPVRADRTRQAA